MGEGEYLSEVCQVRHTAIEKDIGEIRKDIDEIEKNMEAIKQEEHKENDEIKKIIKELSDDMKLANENLKNKIILVNKSMGDKVDELNEFDKKLRGNGSPGVWESIRNIQRNIKVIMATLMLIIILVLGGSYRGISLEKLRQRINSNDQTIEKMEDDNEKEKLVQEEKPVKNKDIIENKP